MEIPDGIEGRMGDGKITTGTTYAQVHGMTTAPLHSNQQVNTKGDVEIYSKDFQDTSAEDEVDIASLCDTFYSDEDHRQKEDQDLNHFGYPYCDTRGRQYLHLTLERLTYIACENQRIRNNKLGLPLGQYISFNEPVPLLTQNRSWPKAPNPVHFELPTLIREVQFPRKFINQSAFDKDLLVNYGLRNNFCTSEMGRSGHFTHITKGFRNWNFSQVPSNKSRFPHFISTEDILSAKTVDGSKKWSEAASALEKQRVSLESINVWHLINLRSNRNSLYYFGQQSKSEMGLQTYSSYHKARNQLSVHQIYSNYINQDLQISEPFEDEQIVLEFIDEEPTTTPILTQPRDERPSFLDFRIFIGENASQYSYNDNDTTCCASSKFPPDDKCYFDYHQPIDSSTESINAKRAVTFAPEVVFIERDMESPFWRDFAERRRKRRIMRQQRIMGSLRNRMSLFDLVKLHFRFPHKDDKPIPEDTEQSEEEVDRKLTSKKKSSESPSSLSKNQSDSKSKCSMVTKFFSCNWCSSQSQND